MGHMYSIRTWATALLTMAIPSLSQAATQGVLGSTSIGTARISVSKPIRAEVRGLGNILLKDWTKDAQSLSQVCIYSATGSYTVTASTRSGAPFQASNGSQQLPYTLSWQDGHKTQRLLPGIPVKSTHLTASTSCSVAQLKLHLDEKTMQTAMLHPGTFAGQLTLLIRPD